MTQEDMQGFISRGFRLTKSQLDYIAEGSYGFLTRAGKSVYRDLKVVAQDSFSGNVVVKETYSGDYSYEKNFMLSPEGRTEKLKLSYQTNPIFRARNELQHG